MTYLLRFLAVTRNTPLEPHSEKIHWAILKTARRAAIPADNLLAVVCQIASRGFVAHDDMQQISAIPNGVSMACESMGLDRENFLGLVRGLRLPAYEFLPRFAERLLAEFGQASTSHTCRNCDFWSGLRDSSQLRCAVVPDGPGCSVDTSNECQHWEARREGRGQPTFRVNFGPAIEALQRAGEAMNRAGLSMDDIRASIAGGTAENPTTPPTELEVQAAREERMARINARLRERLGPAAVDAFQGTLNDPWGVARFPASSEEGAIFCDHYHLSPAIPEEVFITPSPMLSSGCLVPVQWPTVEQRRIPRLSEVRQAAASFGEPESAGHTVAYTLHDGAWIRFRATPNPDGPGWRWQYDGPVLID